MKPSKMTFRHDQQFFDTADYILFIITLLIPISIGIYYSFISKKAQRTVSEYLVGNRNMGVFPVSMSLSASVISGYYLIGPISEVYFYGSQFILMSLSDLTASFFFATLYLPVFYNSKVTSTFEYLESRFDYKVRFLGSVLFLIKTIMEMAFWIYAPVLMFEQVVGVNSNILIPIFSGICIFYTFGGVRSVIWADTFQLILMLLGLIIIVTVGVLDLGGVVKIWEISNQGKRLQVFDFDLDPRLRQSFWIFLVGSGTEHLAYFTASQFVVQRCVSVPTLFKSKMAVIIQVMATSAIIIFSSYIGIMLYAAFHDCDPISAKKIAKPDQLLPYFIMNLKNRVPALPSLFVSVAFCAALSSVSSALNSVSGVVLIDLIRPLSKKPITDAQGSFCMRIITVIVGVLFMAITFTLSTSNNLIHISTSLISIPLGPTFGILTLGILLPWSNATGALIGGIAGVAMVAWISIGNLMASTVNKLAYSTLPLSIENCVNSTLINSGNETRGSALRYDQDKPFFLYSVSFYYYALIGTLTVIIVGMVTSYFTGLNKPSDMDPDIYSPTIRKHFIRPEATSEMVNMATTD